MWVCSVCNVTCCSDYNKKEHLTGRKHHERLLQKQKSNTISSSSSTTNNKRKQQSPVLSGTGQSCDSSKPSSTLSNVVIGNFVLAKKKEGVDCSFWKGKKDSPPKFKPQYKDALKKKRDVNLCIQNGEVVWQFAYNVTIIAAIKEHIRGRRWDPTIGRKGCWVCPLEALPDAIELYEFMGRKADKSLKERAKKLGGTDCIHVSVRLDKNVKSVWLGTVDMTFLYDPIIVTTIKMISPAARSFDPNTKKWSIDLMALPECLNHLGQVGYKPCAGLKSLSQCTEKLVQEISCSGDDQPIASQPDIDNDPWNLGGDNGELDVIDAFWDRTFAIQSFIEKRCVQPMDQQQPPTDTSSRGSATRGCAALDDDDDSAGHTGTAVLRCDTADPEIIVIDDDSNEERHDTLQSDAKARVEKILSEIFGCLEATKKDRNNTIDRSDCGALKKARLSLSQLQWSARRNDSDDDDSDDISYYDRDDINGDDISYSDITSRILNQRKTHSPRSVVPSHCDCGNPHRLQGGVHVCRYFGTFECKSCRNQWTSGYCWKGESQACRRCNTQNAPIKTRPLTKAPPGDRNGGAHDSSRCTMCRRLGYNCSMLNP